MDNLCSSNKLKYFQCRSVDQTLSKARCAGPQWGLDWCRPQTANPIFRSPSPLMSPSPQQQASISPHTPVRISHPCFEPFPVTLLGPSSGVYLLGGSRSCGLLLMEEVLEASVGCLWQPRSNLQQSSQGSGSSGITGLLRQRYSGCFPRAFPNLDIAGSSLLATSCRASCPTSILSTITSEATLCGFPLCHSCLCA